MVPSGNSDDLIKRPKQISFGNEHGCALLESEEVLCWGNNEYGQLGNGKIKLAETFEYISEGTFKLSNPNAVVNF